MDRLEEILGSSGKMRMNESATQGTFPTLLFSHDDFDRNGNIALQKITELFKWVELATIGNPGFILGLNELNDSIRTFFTVGEFTFNPSLYKHAVKCRHDKSVLPVELTSRFVSFGTSSVEMFDAMNANGSEILATLHSKFTLVDLNTRKGKILPESWREKLKPHMNSNMAVPRFVPQERPEGAFRYSTVVRPSDTDFNGHTRSTAYIIACIDAFAFIDSTDGRSIFHNFVGDISMQRVRKLRMWNVAESMVGDELTVHFWEDTKDRSLIHFQIDKQDKIVYHNSTWFYPETDAKL